MLDDYSQIFVASNENNAEIIFNVEYVSLLDQGADWGGWHNDRGVDPDGGYGRIRLQPSFYSQLENGDALIPSNAHFEAEDPRRAFVAVDWDTNKGLVYNNREQIDLNKIGTWKFRHESTPLFRNQTDINCVVLRYADILLIYAEAENELNGPTADAIEKVNEARRRARKGMPSILIPGNTPYNPADVSQCPIVIPDPTPIRASSVPADVSGLTYEQLKETILFDRVKELLMEGSDRFDLVRLGPDAFMHYLQFPKKTKSTKGR